MNLEQVHAGKLADTVIEDFWFGDDDPARPIELASQSLAAAVAEIQGLKPFPAVAQKVMQLTANPHCRLEEVAALIHGDPALASRTLRLANSAAFARGVELDSVSQALVRLGLRRVTSMMTAISVMGMFSGGGVRATAVRDHCVGVAALAQTLSQSCSWEGHERLFLSGLMHDIGRLLLMQTSEAETHDATTDDAEAARSCGSLHLLERRRLGYDHAVLGGHVLTAWGLPESLARVVAWHHQPARAYQVGGDIALQVAFMEMADLLDEELSNEGTWSDEFFTRCAAQSAFSYVDVSLEDLVRHAEAMVEARNQALAAFAG